MCTPVYYTLEYRVDPFDGDAACNGFSVMPGIAANTESKLWICKKQRCAGRKARMETVRKVLKNWVHLAGNPDTKVEIG